MLRTDKPIYKAILVLNLLFIIAGIILCANDIVSINASVSRIISRVVAIACLAFAGFYIISGYTKDAAKYYKMFGALFSIKYLTSILSGSTNSGTPFGNYGNITFSSNSSCFTSK